jgi:hypothetical protein
MLLNEKSNAKLAVLQFIKRFTPAAFFNWSTA